MSGGENQINNFLLVRTSLGRKVKSFGTEAQHKEVRDFLKIINIEFLADLLKVFFHYRINADYYIAKYVNKLTN